MNIVTGVGGINSTGTGTRGINDIPVIDYTDVISSSGSASSVIGIIIVDHGSRKREANDLLIEVIL